MTESQIKGGALLAFRAKLASILISCHRDKNIVHETCNKLDTIAPEERPALIDAVFGPMVTAKCEPLLQQIARLEEEINALDAS